MTQYEIGELDLTAQVSAAQSATNYIHADSSGINIYDSSLTNASKYYLRQTASGTYIYRNSYLKAKYEDTITLYGGSNANGANPRAELTSTTFKTYDASGNQRFEAGGTNGVVVGNPSGGRVIVRNDTGVTIYDTNNKKRTAIDTNGLYLYDTDGSTESAIFSPTFARIGKENNVAFYMNTSSLQAYYMNGNTRTKYFEVTPTKMVYGSFTAASTEDIDNIEIGGTNLLLGADFRNSASTVDVKFRVGSPSYADSNPSPPGYLGNGYARTAGSGAPLQVKLGQAAERAGLKYGDKVVLSAMIMSTEETEISVDISLYNADTNGGKTYGMMGDSSKQYASITLLPNVWTRVWCAFTINQTSMTAEEVYFGYRTNITGQVLRQSSYQLERGTKPTDWSLAKQDIANGALLDTEINQRKAAYGTSDTAASTDKKVVTISDFDKHEGAFLTVKFTNANTSTFPKLQINSQYWRDIYVGNAVGNVFWGAGAVITFKVVNDKFYIIDDGTINYMTCSTAANTASKTLVNSNSNTPYVIFKGRKISVNFTYENTAANPTLKLEGIDRVLYAGSESEKPTVENGLSWGNNSTQEFIYDGSYFRTADSGIAQRSKILSDEAAKTATNYIEQTPSDGIKVVATNNSTTYVQITNSSIGMCKDDIEYIKLWEDTGSVPTVRIGHNVSGHVDITSDGMEIFDNNDSLAKFGTTVRIGIINNTNNTNYLELDSRNLKLIDSSTPYFHVTDFRNSNGEYTFTDTFEVKQEDLTEHFLLSYYIDTAQSITSATLSGQDIKQNIYIDNVIINGGIMTKISYPGSNGWPAAGSLIITYITKSGAAKAFTFGNRNPSGNAGGLSVSLGSYNIASNMFSIAEGLSTTASGFISHAEGYNTLANGQYSHTEGCNTRAYGDSSHAEGYKTSANGYYSHAEGQNTTANRYCSHTEGTDTIADGISSHAEGYNTKANETSSHAEGEKTIANGYASHVEGNSTKANGNNSHAEGYNTFTNGVNSHAEGYNTMTNGSSSHAEGYSTIANENYSHAEGYYTLANGYASHAEGYYTLASGHYSHVSGRYNIEDLSDTYAVIIGNGTADDARSNALTVDWNGKVIANGIHLIGTNVESTTNYPGIVFSDGSSSQWLRTTTNGILPISADSTNGKSSIGTSTWPFANGYFKKINGVTPVLTDTKALGSMTGTLGIAHGGTGVTATQTVNSYTTLITTNSNATISSAKYRKWGKVAQIEITFTPASSTASGAAVTIGTLKSTYCPSITTFIGDARWSGTITSGGTIQVLNSAGTAISGSRTICATWVNE